MRPIILLEILLEKKMIRIADKDDVKQICDIYNYYVENTIITLEEIAVSSKEMERPKRVSFFNGLF
ncbi:MAG: hypothetical protein JEZ04_00715 [Spirochaetales bacterium]|nr:hypothetical protein [Spirochaetales bacterium]